MHPAEVKIIAHSVSEQDIQLPTYQLRYWRGIHAELMTHRVFSRNAGSSRARPSAAIIKQVMEDPWGPLHWGKNEPGMQANEELETDIKEMAIEEWHYAARMAATQANNLRELGAHKQVVNRILEPYTFIDVVLTATEFNNWFALRNHKDADPTIRDLAAQMLEVKQKSIPILLKPGQWHLPYITDADWKEAERFLMINRIIRSIPTYEECLFLLKKISVARCARVSYKAFNGDVNNYADDLRLYERLVGSQPIHASPTEHQATPDERVMGDLGFQEWKRPHYHGNFNGWIQFRKTLAGEFIEG